MRAPWHPARFAQCQGRVDDPEKAWPRSPKRASLEGWTCGLALHAAIMLQWSEMSQITTTCYNPLQRPKYIQWMKHAQTTKPWVQNSVHSCRNQGCIFTERNFKSPTRKGVSQPRVSKGSLFRRSCACRGIDIGSQLDEFQNCGRLCTATSEDGERPGTSW